MRGQTAYEGAEALQVHQKYAGIEALPYERGTFDWLPYALPVAIECNVKQPFAIARQARHVCVML